MIHTIELRRNTVDNFVITYLIKACSFVSLFLELGSKTPVSKLTSETGFFSSFSPTLTRLSKFSLVAISTEDSFLLSVSSCSSISQS